MTSKLFLNRRGRLTMIKDKILQMRKGSVKLPGCGKTLDGPPSHEVLMAWSMRMGHVYNFHIGFGLASCV